MDIDQIEAFVTIAEIGGFTRAAQRLHRTQPAISRRLGLLEQELGAPMFERIRSNTQLTEAGRTFLPHAGAALAALKDGREAVRGLQAGLRGTVSLALVGTLADTRIVDVLRQFVRRTKDVRLELRTASSSEVTRLVRRGEANLGLRYFAADQAELVSLDAGTEGRGALVELEVPGLRTVIPVTAIHRRNGYLGPAATALLRLLTSEVLRSKARPKREAN